MSELDKIIELRLKEKKAKEKMRKRLKTFIALFIILGIIISIIFISSVNGNCKKVTQADILNARQMYLKGEVDSKNMELLIKKYFNEECIER